MEPQTTALRPTTTGNTPGFSILEEWRKSLNGFTSLEEVAVTPKHMIKPPGGFFPEGFDDWHTRLFCSGPVTVAEPQDVGERELYKDALRQLSQLKGDNEKLERGMLNGNNLLPFLQQKCGPVRKKCLAALLRCVRVAIPVANTAKTREDASLFLWLRLDKKKDAKVVPVIQHGREFEEAKLIWVEGGNDVVVTSDWRGRRMTISVPGLQPGEQYRKLPGAPLQRDLCTLKRQEGGNLFCESPQAFSVQGSIAVLPRLLRNKDNVHLFNGMAFQVHSNRLEDQIQGSTEQPFDPRFLHILANLECSGEMREVLNLLGQGPALRQRSQDALVDLTFACLEVGRAALESQRLSIPGRTNNWIENLLRCLHTLSKYRPSSNDPFWLSALQSSLSLWIMDLLETPPSDSGGLEVHKKDEIIRKCAKMLQHPPVAKRFDANTSRAYLRIDDLEIPLKEKEEKISRTRMSSYSLDISNDAPFKVMYCDDGRWWLDTGAKTVFPQFRNNMVIPLYSGCRIQVGPHKLQFIDPAQPMLVGQVDRLLIDSLADLGQECHDIVMENDIIQQTKLKMGIWPQPINSAQERRCVWSLVRLIGSAPMCSNLWHSKIVGLNGHFVEPVALKETRCISFPDKEKAKKAARGLPFDQCGKPMSNSKLDRARSDQEKNFLMLQGEPKPTRAFRLTGSISCPIEDATLTHFHSTGSQPGADRVPVRVPVDDLGQASWNNNGWDNLWVALTLALNRHNEAHRKEFAVDFAVRCLRRGRRQFLVALLGSKPELQCLLQKTSAE